VSWGWDDNVREAMEADKRLDDGFFRFMLEAVPRPYRHGRQGLAFRARGLTEHYARYASDSRYQIEGILDANRSIRRTAVLWGSGRANYRTYPDSTERNFHELVGSLGLSSTIRGGDLNSYLTLRGLDYRRTGSFDVRTETITFDYRRSLRRRLDMGAIAAFDWSRYGRYALRSAREGMPIVDSTRTQNDRGREARLSFQYMRGWLFEAWVAWESIRSNSFGSSIGRRSIGGMTSGWLPGSLLLQIRGRAEATSYRDHGLDEVFISRVGEEREASEDNNSLQIRLRRPVGLGWAVEGRVSWFRNESLLVGSFYRKTLGSLGIVWTPIGSSDF
jgi:hypothetical protein